jgi:hypothetical protein
MVYWLGYSDPKDIDVYYWDFVGFKLSWTRINTKYPDA